MHSILWSRATVARSRRLSKAALVILLGAMSAHIPLAVAESEAGSGSTANINKELLNPNTSLASLTFRSQYRWYEGDLPGADSQSNATFLFQPVFPIDLGRTESDTATKKFFLRPAIPYQVDVPGFDLTKNEFEDDSGLGDIGFDAAYGLSWDTGTQFVAGLVGSLPTASGDVPGGNANLGPEIFGGHAGSYGFIGGLLTHSWDISDWSDNDVSNTSLQAFFSFVLPNSWAAGSIPIMSYDWKSDEATIPLNVYAQKTIKIGNTPTRIQVEFNWYLSQPDPFGPEYFIALNITPVVSNPFQKFFDPR